MHRSFVALSLLFLMLSSLVANAAHATETKSDDSTGLVVVASLTAAMVKESNQLHIPVDQTHAYKVMGAEQESLTNFCASMATKMKGVIAPHLVPAYVVFFAHAPNEYAYSKNTLMAVGAACNSSPDGTEIKCLKRWVNKTDTNLPAAVREYYLRKARSLAHQ